MGGNRGGATGGGRSNTAKSINSLSDGGEAGGEHIPSMNQASASDSPRGRKVMRPAAPPADPPPDPRFLSGRRLATINGLLIIGGALMALMGGTTNAFNILQDKIQADLGMSATYMNVLASAGLTGTNLNFLAGIFKDKFGAAATGVAAAILGGLSYFVMSVCVTSSYSVLLVIAFVLAGLGGGAAFNAAMAVVVASSPTGGGIGVSVVTSAMGLSVAATIFVVNEYAKLSACSADHCWTNYTRALAVAVVVCQFFGSLLLFFYSPSKYAHLNHDTADLSPDALDASMASAEASLGRATTADSLGGGRLFGRPAIAALRDETLLTVSLVPADGDDSDDDPTQGLLAGPAKRNHAAAGTSSSQQRGALNPEGGIMSAVGILALSAAATAEAPAEPEAVAESVNVTKVHHRVEVARAVALFAHRYFFMLFLSSFVAFANALAVLTQANEIWASFTSTSVDANAGLGAWILSAFSYTNVVAAFGAGVICDLVIRYKFCKPQKLVAVTYFVSSLTLLALGLGLNSSDGTPSELAKWVVFCSLVWTSVPFGVMLTVFPTVLGEAYGHVNFGKFFGLLNLAPTTASLVTAIIVGSIYRAVGSYAVIFWGMGALMFVNSIVLFFVNNTTALPKFVTAKSAPKALPPPGSVGRSVY